MESEKIMCPVCTLYLRPSITLKAHLRSHPKQMIIDALINRNETPNNNNEVAVPTALVAHTQQTLNNINTSFNDGFSPMSTNHSFIYQQFMATTNQPPPSNVVNVNPLSQQYITVPTVFNPQLACLPYVYQQQQVILSGGSAMPPLTQKPSLIDLSNDSELQHPVETGLLSDDESKMELQDEVDNSSKMAEDDVIIINDTLLNNETVIKDSSMRQDVDLEEEKNLDEFSLDNTNYNSTEDPLSDPLEDSVKNLVKNQIMVTPKDTIKNSMDEFSGQDEDVCSPESSDYVQIRKDLNKACQTQVSETSNIIEDNLSKHSYYEINDTPHITTLQNNFEQNDNYSINVVPVNDEVIDMDGMQLVLCSSDLLGSQLISQVDDFECLSNRSERTTLMNIGGMDNNIPTNIEPVAVEEDPLLDESISRDSTNMSIRADEHMPPRGELSGQESNGATSDITWNRIQYDVNSRTSTSYDLLAREIWEGSECSDNDMPSLHNSLPPDLYDDTPTIVSVTAPPLNFKCPFCNDSFSCPKERKEHQIEKHSKKEESDSNTAKISNSVIGSKLIDKKPIKKLVIKPKKNTDIKSENNFDNVFTNKIKADATIEDVLNKIETRDAVIAAVSSEVIIDKKDLKCFSCALCSTLFTDIRSLKKHKAEEHGITALNRFTCYTCKEDMHNAKAYNKHLRIHPLECQLCGKYFHSQQSIRLHTKRHLGLKAFECDFCKKCFLTKQKLEEHKHTHTGEAPIKCTMCNERFRRYSNLVQHRNRHHLKIKKKVKDYLCYCGEVFHTKKKLAWHEETHEAKPKACSYCNEKFVHMASLTRHMRRAHNERFVPREERDGENVQCPICKGVYLKTSLEVHIRNHSGKRPYSCLICNKEFTTKWNLKLHKWTHASRALKPYQCDQCNAAYVREADYTSHMNSHKCVRPFVCNYCGAKFIRKYNCQRHVKEHEASKTFTCSVCNKTFHRSYYLKDHMRIHSGIRPFTCNICGKSSTTKSNHNKHIVIHHARDPVSSEH